MIDLSSSPTLTVRDVVPGDAAFLRRLFASTAPAPLLALPVEQRDGLLDMMRAGQERTWRAAWPAGRELVVLRNGEPAGRVWLAQSATELRLVDIALEPLHRGQGVGAELVVAMQQRAQAEGVPLVAAVQVDNPARRFYARLGFAEFDVGDAMHVGIRWGAAAVGEPELPESEQIGRWRSRLGSELLVDGVPLVLAEVAARPMPPATPEWTPARQPFCLLFHAPADCHWPQGTRTLETPDGTAPAFLVPVGVTPAGLREYEAVFG